MKPIQLITVEDDGSIKVHEKTLTEIIESFKAEKLKVVSLSGPKRSGKSTLLNTWIGQMGAFDVGHTTTAVTHGVWMGVMKHKGHVLILLDTQGWHDGTTKEQDIWLSLIMLFVSDELVINIKSNIDEYFIKNVSSILRFGLFNSRDAQPTDYEVPFVRTLVRDFDLELEQKTPDDYLSEQIAGDTFNHKLLKKYMVRNRCHILERPHKKPKLLGTRSEGKLVQPDDDFKADAFRVLDSIVEDGNGKCNGAVWCRNVLSVTKAIEKLRKSDPRGERFHMDVRSSDIVDTAKHCYVQDIESWDIVTDSVESLTKPFETEKLKKCHEKSKEVALAFLGDTDETINDYVEKCYKSVKEHRSELQNEYERLCGFAISFQDFMERQPKPKELLFEQGVMASMCQRNLLNLLDKITKNEEWMKKQVSIDVTMIERSLEADEAKNVYKIQRRQFSDNEEREVVTLEKNMVITVKKFTSLCQDIYELHAVWLKIRCKTITSLQKAIRTLNSLKVVFDIMQVTSQAAGIATTALTVGSFVAPVLAPAAGYTAAYSMGGGLGNVIGSLLMSKLEEGKFSETMKIDETENARLQNKMRELINNMEHSIVEHYNRGKLDSLLDGVLLCTSTAFSTAGGVVGDIARELSEAGKKKLSAVSGLSSAAGLTVGGSLSLLMLIDTLKNMDNEHEMSKLLNNYIDKLEMEIELYTRIVIPMKHHLLKHLLEQSVIHPSK